MRRWRARVYFQEHIMQRYGSADGGHSAFLWEDTEVKSSVGKLQREVHLCGLR